jgi:hypothetical protein
MTAVIGEDGRVWRPESALRRGLRRLRGRAAGTAAVTVASAARAALGVAKAKAQPAVAHVREHAYSIMGFATVDAAMFTHSLFTGLLVTGISLFVFEWKVTPEGEEDATTYS